MRNGIVYGMSNEIYHGGDEVSVSALKEMLRSPAHYQSYKQQGSGINPKVALDGNIAHCALLEPGELHNRYVVGPQVDKRTKAGKEEWATFEANAAGKEVITQEQMDMAIGMQAQFASYAKTNNLAEHGKAEVSIFWEDSGTGLKCRCRPDLLVEFLDDAIVLDVKTIDDARQFSRNVVSYGYAMQEAFYRVGCGAVGINVDQFIFLVIEKKPPYSFMLYELDKDLLHYAERQCVTALQLIAECEATGVWPGYSNDIRIISKPTWMGDAA